MIDARMEMLIWDHHQANPPGMMAYRQWCEDTAEKFECRPNDVRLVVTKMSLRAKLTLQQQIATASQQAAYLLGVDETNVIRTLVDATKAEAVRPMLRRKYDSEGKVQEDFIEEVKYADHNVRVKAASELADILGMRAPEQVEVNATHTHTHEMAEASIEEIAAKANEIAAKLSHLHGSKPELIEAGSAPGTPETGKASRSSARKRVN